MIFLLLVGAFGNPLDARQWKSAKGSSKIEADFISATAITVTIKRDDNGKSVTVPLAKLCEADQKYVAKQLAKDSESEQATLAVKRGVTKFYSILRKTERKELKDLLTKAAQATFDSNSAFFDGISAADRNFSPRVRSVEFKGDRATADLSVKIAGKSREVKFMLKRDDEDWLIEALAYKDDDDEFKRMDFATGQTSDGLEAVNDADDPMVEGGAPESGTESGENGQRDGDVPAGEEGATGPSTLGPPPTARPPATMITETGQEGP